MVVASKRVAPLARPCACDPTVGHFDCWSSLKPVAPAYAVTPQSSHSLIQFLACLRQLDSYHAGMKKPAGKRGSRGGPTVTGDR